VKLLFDQNLSRKLPRKLDDLFPGSMHVTQVVLDRADDDGIWQYAKENNLIIISKDDDFRERSVRLGHPPKVVQVRAGNCSSKHIETIIRENVQLIVEFERDPQHGYLEIA
jgi:predicted nuclease of predicted toxin-antitoxin system